LKLKTSEMQLAHSNEKIFLSSRLLSEKSVFHFFSTKIGWNGHTRFTGDSEEICKQHRISLAVELKLKPEQLVFPRQTHGTGVAVIHSAIDSADVPDTDALITNVPNLCMCVQTADCVPILLFDPVQKVVAAIHAGWRGTVKKIVKKTITEMEQSFGCSPADLVATIGPSISTQKYEVGEDVISAVNSAFENAELLFEPSALSNKCCFNLWEANKTLMVDSGIPEMQIGIMGVCTYSENEVFYSARRDGADTGRMVSGIMIN